MRWICVTVVHVDDDDLKRFEQSLRRGWYQPGETARAAVVALATHLSGHSVSLPDVHGNMFSGVQCEWADHEGEVIVLIDAQGTYTLIDASYKSPTGPSHEATRGTEGWNPVHNATLEQITEVLVRFQRN